MKAVCTLTTNSLFTHENCSFSIYPPPSAEHWSSDVPRRHPETLKTDSCVYFILTSEHFSEYSLESKYLYVFDWDDASQKIVWHYPCCGEKSMSAKGCQEIVIHQESTAAEDIEDIGVVDERHRRIYSTSIKFQAWNRSNLMIVGEARVGKTAVTNAIIGKPFCR